ncbi:unnamed protein product [Protopolystoma xenopodis]|uniref:Uncharacterized protein n=1 Tax=Protopolystoma xenopodis TaxID=117903 RepID=A0A448XQG6_9PLAT|nr:unnamed protein product [Protopolystoma xenopodis]
MGKWEIPVLHLWRDVFHDGTNGGFGWTYPSRRMSSPFGRFSSETLTTSGLGLPASSSLLASSAIDEVTFLDLSIPFRQTFTCTHTHTHNDIHTKMRLTFSLSLYIYIYIYMSRRHVHACAQAERLFCLGSAVASRTGSSRTGSSSFEATEEAKSNPSRVGGRDFGALPAAERRYSRRAPPVHSPHGHTQAPPDVFFAPRPASAFADRPDRTGLGHVRDCSARLECSFI